MPELWTSRTEKLIGPEAAARLARAHALVVGVGGVGSHAAEGLCRAGVGRLTLVDPDAVERSNMNRQLQATTLTIGRAKAEALAERFRAINPGGAFEAVVEMLSSANVARLVVPGVDVVVDAIDSLEAKAALLVHCARRDIPVVSCLGAALKLDPTLVHVASLGETRACPLARKLRALVREEAPEALAKIVAVFTEEVVPKHEGPVRPLGSMPFVPAAVGITAAYAAFGLLLHGELP